MHHLWRDDRKGQLKMQRMPKKAWLEAALEEGIEIHEPGSLEEYSGQFKIRMPRSLQPGSGGTLQKKKASV